MKSRFKTDMTTATIDGEQTRVPDLGGVETQLRDSDADLPLGDRDGYYSVSGDHAAGGRGVLVAVGGSRELIERVRAAEAPTELTDRQAAQRRMELGFRPEIEHSDTRDPEIDARLSEYRIRDVTTEDERNVLAITFAHRVIGRGGVMEIANEYGRASSLPMLLHVKTTPEDRAEIVQDRGLPIPDGITPDNAARAVIQGQTVGRQVLQDQELTAALKLAKLDGRPGASGLPHSTREVMDGEMSERTVRALAGCHGDHGALCDYALGRRGRPWESFEHPPGVGTVPPADHPGFSI